jgi:hypothetical protein
MKPIAYYTDPGHGWFAVKRTELADLGLLDKVSTYSYQRGQTVYLEEDCDASLYFAAYRAAHGTHPAYVEKNTNKHSPIRSYDTFKVAA